MTELYLACFRHNVGSNIGWPGFNGKGYTTNVDQAHVVIWQHKRKLDIKVLNFNNIVVNKERLKKMSNFTEAYIPSFGYGWYNESISYDALTGVHKNLYVKTDQKATNGNQRTDNSSNPSGYRVRAGFVDPKSDKRF